MRTDMTTRPYRNTGELRLISDYNARLQVYESYAERLRQLIKEVSAEHQHKIHSITNRVKAESSLSRKISTKHKYRDIGEVTDIVGIRIITYYADDVDAIAEVIESEFNVDRDSSIDKRQITDPDRFGYKSLHYVVRLNSARCSLREYKQFASVPAEIQIRSIIQHAWAEIEHDLGYKSEIDIPATIRRRFYRLAALLEIADDEFLSIKRDLEKYESRVNETISSLPETLAIDATSLAVYTRSSFLVRSLNEEIAQHFKINIDEDLSSPDMVLTQRIKELQTVNIRTIKDLNDALLASGALAVSFAKKWMSAESAVFNETIVFYLFYVIVAQYKDVHKIALFLEEAGFSPDEGETFRDFAQQILATYHTLAPAAR